MKPTFPKLPSRLSSGSEFEGNKCPCLELRIYYSSYCFHVLTHLIHSYVPQTLEKIKQDFRKILSLSWLGPDLFLIILSPSLSYHATSTDLPDTYSPPVSIIRRSQEVFQATSYISTELWYIGSSWTIQPLLVHVKESTGEYRL